MATSYAELTTVPLDLKYLETPAVKIVVGRNEEARKFSIHEGLLTPRAEYFTRALKGHWQESDDRVINLPDDDPDAFSLYSKILYTRPWEHSAVLLPSFTDKNIKVDYEADGNTDVQKEFGTVDDNTSDKQFGADEFLGLCKLFVLAEKLIDSCTKEILLTLMKSFFDPLYATNSTKSPDFESIATIYDGTPEGSPARTFVVQLFTDHVRKGITLDEHSYLPFEFLYELSSSLLVQRPFKSVFEKQREQLEQQERDIKQKERLIALFAATIHRVNTQNGG
ncbi:hypothetical protein N0V90_010034 [Kalmusia sp. IMI 367209]|nr:hypothetical protein N0V90_010034 [Kalmusia sp. IMI 367209]